MKSFHPQQFLFFLFFPFSFLAACFSLHLIGVGGKASDVHDQHSTPSSIPPMRDWSRCGAGRGGEERGGEGDSPTRR